ncbi:chromosomal replication initiator protein DnaA [Butyrivibrio sp. LC3010]|uniref:chromosomal replication initiator protein DnaA n=1 Tax=Butyrivibrio sp. LC3010 TaxID=1280680 RepID=UPI00041B9202|nr:chromosomal replication initiator protein DnaA [Butyrivibrio sp. LC3010]
MNEDKQLEDLIRENWDYIKEEVKQECALTPISYSTWVEPLTFLRYANETAYILISQDNAMALDYVKRRFMNFFIVAISEITGLDRLTVEFSLQNDQSKVEEKIEAEKERTSRLITKFNSKFTFENFVVGDSNRFAYSAAVAVAENPGTVYNPLFLYGKAGLGKTHLLQAIGDYICRNNDDKNVLYVTSEDFLNEVVQNVHRGQGGSKIDGARMLHEKYRTVDVLMIDDIQFLIGKDSTQLEFFHTFNALYQEGKQIVLSADRHPKEIKELDDRIRSRFQMGLTSDIQLPDYETRMAILMRLHEGKILDIDSKVFDYIAEGVVSNIRELEGAYTKIVAYSKLNKLDHIGMEEAMIALKDDIANGRARDISPTKIISTVAEQYGVKIDDLMSKKRSNDIVLPRQLSMYLIREYTDTTLEGIGKELGNRDHSTVKSSIDKITELLSVDEDLNRHIEIICMKLNLDKR